ncbi:MAG: hypothetical protein QHH43_08525 [Candidatus Saccharicenans sp.]|jgi:hypothetical protein|nr:hypothetical protein [Candidatus Saccharicenans sp.]MDH7575784.1 hypothetical protein [Candidatus Saccharicenans sp.]
MIARIIMIAYYLISVFFVLITIKNLLKERDSRDRVVLYLVTLIPFILRLLRIK